MATNQKMDELGRMLECSICLERMKSPRMLSCLHSFCEGCLEQHMVKKGESGYFRCPVCNTEIKIPQDGVTFFKRNFFLAEVSELFVQSVDVKCDVCKIRGADSPATSMCLQCSDHLCDNCAKYHCLSRLTVNHRVVDLEEVRNGEHFEEIRNSQKISCTTHKDEVLKLYCETCDTVLCLLCTVLDHKQHEIKNIQDAAKNADDVIQGLLPDWMAAAEQSEKLSAERKSVLGAIKEQTEQMAIVLGQKYESFKERILKEIEIKQNAAASKMTEVVSAAIKQAEVAYSEAELSRETITGTLNYARKILDSAQDVEKLQQFSEIKSRLEELDIRKLATRVDKPVFKLLPGNIAVPDLNIDTVTEYENSQIESTLSQQIRQPSLKEKAVLVRSVKTTLDYGKIPSYYGLCVSDNRIITTDYENEKVKVFDKANSRFLFECQVQQYEHPWDVTCNSTGEIFVTDRYSHGVIGYDVKGHVMKKTERMYRDAGYITCHEDKLIVTDDSGGRILITDFDCNIKQVIDKSSLGLEEFNPRYVCVNNGGYLVVRDSQGRVHVIDYQKSTIIKTFTEGLNNPYGVSVDEWGNILVANCGNHQVVLMSASPDNVQVLITADDVTDPTALAISGPGEVAVLEYEGDIKIFKYMDV